MARAAVVSTLLAFVVAASSGTASAGVGSTASTSSGTKTVTTPSKGLTVVMPEGWKQQKPSDDPQDINVDFYETLQLFTESPFVGDYDCSAPGAASTVVLYIDASLIDSARSAAVTPRPKRFDQSSGTGFRSGDEHQCGESAQDIAFREKGYVVNAQVIRARRAPSARVAQAYRILQSLKVKDTGWLRFCDEARAVASSRNSLGSTPAEIQASIRRLVAVSPDDRLTSALREATPVLVARAQDGSTPIPEALTAERVAVVTVMSALGGRCSLEPNAFLYLIYPDAPSP